MDFELGGVVFGGLIQVGQVYLVDVEVTDHVGRELLYLTNEIVGLSLVRLFEVNQLLLDLFGVDLHVLKYFLVQICSVLHLLDAVV